MGLLQDVTEHLRNHIANTPIIAVEKLKELTASLSPEIPILLVMHGASTDIHFDGFVFGAPLFIRHSLARSIFFKNCSIGGDLRIENCGRLQQIDAETLSLNSLVIGSCNPGSKIKMRGFSGSINLLGGDMPAFHLSESEIRFVRFAALNAPTATNFSITNSKVVEFQPNSFARAISTASDIDLSGTEFACHLEFSSQARACINLKNSKLKGGISFFGTEIFGPLELDGSEIDKVRIFDVSPKKLSLVGTKVNLSETKKTIFKLKKVDQIEIGNLKSEDDLEFLLGTPGTVISGLGVSARNEILIDGNLIKISIGVESPSTKVRIISVAKQIEKLSVGGSFSELNLPAGLQINGFLDITGRVSQIYLDNLSINGESIFQDLIVDGFSVNNSEFRNSTLFRNVTFKKAPEFFEAKIFHDTIFRSCKFEDASKESENAYRQLKKHMAETHNSYQESIFGAHEVRARRSGIDEWNSEKVLSYLYDFANGYGEAYLRPVFWLVVLFITMAPYYAGVSFFGITNERVTINPRYLTDVKVTVKAPELPWYDDKNVDKSHGYKGRAYSLLNTLGPFRILSQYDVFIPASTVAAFFSTLHTMVSTLLWYLFLGGVRRRFKTLDK